MNHQSDLELQRFLLNPLTSHENISNPSGLNPRTKFRNARFVHNSVRNFWRVCSQFWLSVRNSVCDPSNRNPRGNPSLASWERGGLRGTKIENRHFGNKLAFPKNGKVSRNLCYWVWPGPRKGLKHAVLRSALGLGGFCAIFFCLVSAGFQHPPPQNSSPKFTPKIVSIPLQFHIFEPKIFHADFLLTGETKKCTCGGPS